MTEQSNIQKIKQLLKSTDKDNHILAVQLMKGLNISVDEMVESISIEDDSEDHIGKINTNWDRILIGFNSCWAYNAEELNAEGRNSIILNYIERRSLSYLSELYKLN